MNLLVQWRGYDWGMGSGMMGYGYGMSWYGHIIMLILWVAVIVAIVVLIRWLILSSRTGGPRASHDDEDTALAILKKRYARGEIDKQEFEEKKKDLMT
jgi:putative membrane protein